MSNAKVAKTGRTRQAKRQHPGFDPACELVKMYKDKGSSQSFKKECLVSLLPYYNRKLQPLNDHGTTESVLRIEKPDWYDPVKE